MDTEKVSQKADSPGFTTGGNSRAGAANKTLAEVVKSHDQGAWEAFPPMLAAAAEAGKFNYAEVNACLEEEERKFLKLLIIISLGLYDSLGLEFPWRAQLFGTFPARLIANFSRKLELDAALELGEVSLLGGRLKANMLKYQRTSPGAGKPDVKTREAAALEAALSRLFTARQKDLLFKKLNRERMTKTEKEYFSRVIKKKIQALANEDLHRLARRVLE